MIWFKRFDHLRFVSTSGLGTDGGDKSAPPSPQEMQERIFDQCSRARAILQKASIPGPVQTRSITIGPHCLHIFHFAFYYSWFWQGFFLLWISTICLLLAVAARGGIGLGESSQGVAESDSHKRRRVPRPDPSFFRRRLRPHVSPAAQHGTCIPWRAGRVYERLLHRQRLASPGWGERREFRDAEHNTNAESQVKSHFGVLISLDLPDLT